MASAIPNMRRLTPIRRLRLESLEDRAIPAVDYIPIDFSEFHNTRFHNLQPASNGLPEGNVTLGSIPFEIPVGSLNAWWGEAATGSYPRSISIDISEFGVTEVHTLINTSYGTPGPASYVALEFIGSDGAFYRKEMFGNDDVRDHFQAWWTNSINGTTTINVATSGPGGTLNESRLDKQFIDLPATFDDETLETIRVIDSGRVLVSGVILQGLTVGVESSPDVVATTLTHSSQGGVDFTYTVAGADLIQNANAELYWATGATFADRIGGPAYAKPVEHARGTYGPIHVDAATLGESPVDATHLQLVFDSSNAIYESNEDNNVLALGIQDITIENAVFVSAMQVDVAYQTQAIVTPFQVQLVRSADLIPDASDVAIGDPFTITPPSPSYQGVETLTVTDPNTPVWRDADRPYILAIADLDQHVSEANEENNLASFEPPAYATAGTVIDNVILSQVLLPIALPKPSASLVALQFDELAVRFTTQPENDANIWAVAQSNSATLSFSVSQPNIGIGLPLANSTGSAMLAVHGGDVPFVRWHTDNFHATPVPSFAGIPVDYDSGPMTIDVPLADMGLTLATPFETTLRVAEAHIHEELSRQLPYISTLMTTLYVVHDPGTTDLLVTDPDGQQTGRLVDGTIVSNIPYSAYLPADPLLLVFAPKAGEYSTEVCAYAPGEFTIATAMVSDLTDLTSVQEYAGTLAASKSAQYATELGAGSAATIPVNQAFVTDGELHVFGTPGNDNIQVARHGSAFRVKMNRVSFGSFKPTGTIKVHAGDGNDRVVVHSTVANPGAIDGDDGNDKLIGGVGPDSINGGGGNDTIVGGKGNDQLDGGVGFLDAMTGNNGNDTLNDADGVARALGGHGNDSIAISFAANWNVNGSTKLMPKSIGGGNDDDQMRIESHNSLLYFTIFADNGNDRIELDGAWAGVRVFGGRGADILKNNGVGLLSLNSIGLEA